MTPLVADQLNLFREQAESWPVRDRKPTAHLELEDLLAFAVFAFHRLRDTDERLRLGDETQDEASDADMLQTYRDWGKAANLLQSALSDLEAKGFDFCHGSEFRQCCREARGVLANEIAYTPPSREYHAKESLEELLSRVTDENIHEEVDFGPPKGKEVW